ncbi:hypothetical protein T439DRAFT_323981 [Meredithblackwellia eburnea MCA 4105]
MAKAFIDYGFKLFQDTPSTSVPFVVGDIFSHSFFDPSAAPTHPDSLDLRTLDTLTPLTRRVRHVHCGSFFHLFDEPTQLSLAQLVVQLLVPKQGSTIFGSHAGSVVPGVRKRDGNRKKGRDTAWRHSPESWTQLWEKVVGKDKIHVRAHLEDRRASVDEANPEKSPSDYLLVWAVTLLWEI